jgi:hypothetical protein
MRRKLNEGRSQIKRKYGDYSNIRVNEKAPIRNKIVNFIGKRFVTEEELKSELTKLTEDTGKAFDERQWFKRNQRYFESFENRGQKVWTLSKYGKRVLEFINKPKENIVMENRSIGLFKNELFESVINEGALAKKAFNLYDTVDIIMDEFDDKETIEIHEFCCRILGEDPSNVCRLDSESDYEDDVLYKAYEAIDNKFKGISVENLPKSIGTGQSISHDNKLGVVRYDDYGFVAYFFTSNSNF